MTTEIEGGLRETLHRLADVSAPNRLASKALGQAHRRRRNQRLTGVSTIFAVMVAVAAVLVPSSVLNRPTQPANGRLAVTTGRYVMSSYCVTDRDEDPSTQVNLYEWCAVLDPASGRYRRLSSNLLTQTGSPSPDGRRYLVSRAADSTSENPPYSYAIVDRDDVFTTDGRNLHWVTAPPSMRPMGWSPDSRKLLFGVLTSTPNAVVVSALRLLDAASGRFEPEIGLQDGPYSFAALSWDPSGRSVWVTSPAPRAPTYRLTNVDLSGRPVGNGVVATPFAYLGKLVVSPDNRLLLNASGAGQVFDLRTGARVHRSPWLLTDTHRSDMEVFGWYGEGQVMAIRRMSHGDAVVVVDLDGNVVRQTGLPTFPGKMVSVRLTLASGYPAGMGLRI